MSTKRKHESENEDAPEPFESSGDEWDGQAGRKSARVVKKAKRVAEDSDDEEDKDEGEFSEEEPKGKKAGPKGKDNEDGEGSDGDFKGEEQPQKKKPGPKKAATKPAAKSSAKATPKKKKAATNESEGEEDSSEEDNSDNEDSSGSDKLKTIQPLPKTIYSEDFATDSFVILKKDIKGGPQARPVIWRIDGKAKLQKFEAFDEGDKVQHRNTPIYTGWSPLDRELYAPLKVDVKSQFKSKLEVVEVHWNELSAVDDSD
ncbi:unnamed protein product [Ceutorhynchus assimilis]|uniref:Uncharacterized protein n=1 Tax=Ceutorhynchus assimilis TaxID=467358 RepID=A0A9P0E0B1_9CUCU|nr:unnamed protein product [Ceutorhynchus assimilis]